MAKADKADQIYDLLDELTLAEMVEITAMVMNDLNSYEEPNRYAMLFTFMQEHHPEAFEEFAARFAEWTAEKEEQE